MAYEYWRGPSEIDGQEIVCLISNNSSNEKTGPQLQIWFLRTDMPPSEAIKTGNDRSICGDCKLRNGICYVLAFMGPRIVWESWYANPQPMPERFVTKRDSNRFGAYGDPAAMPYEKAIELAEQAPDWTGFTHQWRTCDQRYKHLLMASVESLEEAEEAQAMGWRTSRTGLPGEKPVKGEAHCPASQEKGKKLTCIECHYCSGHGKGFKGNVYSEVHGAPWKVKRFEATIRPQNGPTG